MNQREEQIIKEKASKKAKESWTELPKMIMRFNGKEYSLVFDDEDQKWINENLKN